MSGYAHVTNGFMTDDCLRCKNHKAGVREVHSKARYEKHICVEAGINIDVALIALDRELENRKAFGPQPDFTIGTLIRPLGTFALLIRDTDDVHFIESYEE